MTSSWLVPLARPADPAYEIICFPWAGGGAAGFHPFRRHIRGDVALSAVAPPGRQQRLAESVPADLEGWVAAIASDLDRADPPPTTAPLVLLGHSFGAILAYEVARRLRAVGSTLALLCVSSRRAPGLPLGHPSLVSAPDRALVAWMRRLGGVPDGVLDDPEMLSLILPPLRIDLVLDRAYRPSASDPLDVPVLGLAGRDDPCVAAGEMAGWSRVTTATFRLHRIAGGHFHLTERPERTLALIREALERGRGAPRHPAGRSSFVRAPSIDMPELTR